MFVFVCDLFEAEFQSVFKKAQWYALESIISNDNMALPVCVFTIIRNLIY